MDFTRPPDEDEIKSTGGTIIIPKEGGSYPMEAFQLHFKDTELKNYGFAIDDILRKRGEEYMEINLEALALLIWEHRQYADAQEFSISVVRIHRAIQALSKQQDRIFPRDIQSHPLAESYSGQTIQNGLEKLINEGFVEKGDSRGEYRYKGPVNYVPSRDILPLNDLEGKLSEQNESSEND